MNLCAEYTSLSKHLMLFLVAVFAFTAEPLLASKSSLVLWLYLSSFALAIASFLAGYGTHFQIFNTELRNESVDKERCIPARKSRILLHLQYTLTVLSLLCVAAAIMQQLLSKIAMTGNP